MGFNCSQHANDSWCDKIQSCNHLTNILSQWTIEELEAFCRTPENIAYSSSFPISIVNEDDPVFILYTSGTTGFPKGAIYSHKMLFWNSINTAMSLLINTESRSINVMPLFHTGGWNVLITPFIHHGGYMLMMKKFEPSDVLKALETEKMSIFMGVPTMLKMIAEDPGFSDVDLSSLYYLIVGGEPMPIPLIEQWEKKGVPVRQGFGMTEVGPNLTSLHQDDAIRKKGTIGRPNYYVETRIVDKNGQDCQINEPGEFLLKGPMVTPGYWKNEKATKKAITDGWFHSGDMLIRDEDGYLFVVDRIKNMYISGGENVYPAEIERVLRSHKEIVAAAVVSMPDEKWGEVGKAFIVKTPQSLLSDKTIKTFCETHLAKFKVPKNVIFIDELPVNDTGKIDKLKLQSI